MHELSANPNSVSFTPSEYNNGLDVMEKFLQFYCTALKKWKSISKTHLFFEEGKTHLIPSTFMRGPDNTFTPNGHRMSYVSALQVAMLSEIIELRNEIGDGGCASGT